MAHDLTLPRPTAHRTGRPTATSQDEPLELAGPMEDPRGSASYAVRS